MGATLLAVVALPSACFEPREQPAGSQRPPKAASAQRPRKAASLQPAPRPRASASAVPPPGRSDCPRFTAGEEAGKIEDRAVTEASGLAASRQNPGVLWTHNDSGDRARLFAMATDGRELGSYSVKKAKAIDWEDLALGPGPEPGKWYLYVGDIGGNHKARKKVVVYRTLEPGVKLDQKAKTRKLDDVDALELDYPKGDAYDAETLMLDPSTSDLYLVTKALKSTALVFVARAPHSHKHDNELERVATLRLPTASPGAMLTTGGDIAPDGSAIIIRTYSRAYWWSRKPAQTVGEALQAEPCRIPVREEPQGESIAFTAKADGYFTVSEGKRSPIYRYSQEP
jgi:hypothetical protein